MVCSILNGANGCIRSALTQQGDHRKPGHTISHGLQQVERGSVGKADVENGCVGAKLLQLQLCVALSRRFGNHMAGGHEEVAYAGSYDWIGIDYENSILTQALTYRHERVLEGLGPARAKFLTELGASCGYHAMTVSSAQNCGLAVTQVTHGMVAHKKADPDGSAEIKQY